jgi:hypothetical protein
MRSDNYKTPAHSVTSLVADLTAFSGIIKVIFLMA